MLELTMNLRSVSPFDEIAQKDRSLRISVKEQLEQIS